MPFEEMLAKERRARMAAERLLQQKQAELYEANKILASHARNLSTEIVETRGVVEEVKEENTLVRANLEKVTHEVVIHKRRLLDSLETIQDGFAVFDRDSRLIIANGAYLAPFDGLECMQPGLRYHDIVQIMLEEGIIDIGNQRPRDWYDEMLARWSSPEIEPKVIKFWDQTYIRLVDRRGEGGDTVSMGLNITETMRYERDLEGARDEAEAASRAKSAFLANMSHELRTPMNGVVGMADLMAESELDDEQRLYIDTIRNSGNALLTIINDVLDFSKMEAAKLTLNTAPFDLEQTVLDIVTLLQPTIQEKSLQILVDYDMFLPTIYEGDQGRIRQVLTNLIGNAVKFTAEGHVLIRVVGLPIDPGPTQRVHITVEDSGIGIAQDMQAHVFGEFNQVEDERNRKFEGTGLGLAITKQLVELMGGEIWIESEKGVGSCFGLHITLPVIEQAEEASLPGWLTDAALIMPDDMQRAILEKRLIALGLKVTKAAWAADTGYLAQGADVIFLDAALSGQSASEMAHELRQSGTKAPLIQITSQGVQLQSGGSFVGGLSKPTSRPAIIAILSELAPPEVQAEPVFPARKDAALPTRSLPDPEAEAKIQTAPVQAPVQAAPVQAPVFGSSRTSRTIPEPVAPAAPVESAPPVIHEAAPDNPRIMRILAAEDNKTNRLVFSKLVKTLDIDLHFACNGLEAVEAFKTFQPDLIFMDISMPEMDGKEATRTIRALEAAEGLPHTRIVALTAHAMTGDGDEIMSHGLDAHLTKPLRKPAIFAEIEANCPQDVRPPIPAEPAKVATNG